MSEEQWIAIINSEIRTCNICKKEFKKSEESKTLRYGIYSWGNDVQINCRNCIETQIDEKWEYYEHLWDQHLSNVEKKFYLFIPFSPMKKENNLYDVNEDSRWENMDLVQQWFFILTLVNERLPKRPNGCECEHCMDDLKK